MPLTRDDFEDLKDTWNGRVFAYSPKTIKKIFKLGAARQARLLAHFSENDQFPRDFKKCCEIIRKSPFLLGFRSFWAVSFDWLISADGNYRKVLSGDFNRNFKKQGDTMTARREYIDWENEYLVRRMNRAGMTRIERIRDKARLEKTDCMGYEEKIVQMNQRGMSRRLKQIDNDRLDKMRLLGYTSLENINKIGAPKYEAYGFNPNKALDVKERREFLAQSAKKTREAQDSKD